MSTHPGLAGLVIVRLLAATEGSTIPSELRKDLEPLVRHRWYGAALSQELARTLDELAQEGYAAQSGKRWILTDAGRRQAREYLGLSQSANLQWKTAKSRWLVARALRIEQRSPEVLERISGKDGLRSAILRQHFGLPLGEAPALAQTRAALGWALLQQGARPEVSARLHRRDSFTAGDVLAALVYSHLGLVGTPDPRKALDIAAAQAIGSTNTGPNALREALLRRLLEEAPEQRGPELPHYDLEPFARQALAAAQNSPTGRYGDDRVFISHAWLQFQREHPEAKLTEAKFKERLLEANRARHLSLACADMAPLLDPVDVASSEILHLSASFHLICI